MEHCNVCNVDINDPEEHVKSKEHKDNIERLKARVKDYEDDRIGIMP